jgi:DNA repair protein RadC
MCAKMTDDAPPQPMSGHRERLRQRFAADPAALPDSELLELLVTFAVPRRDVAPVAAALLDRFGTVDGVLQASRNDLLAIDGLGLQATMLLMIVRQMVQRSGPPQASALPDVAQLSLLADAPDDADEIHDASAPARAPMRVFVDDEFTNALTFLPQAAGFESTAAFRTFLQQRLPYNSEETRRRRAKYVIDRYLPDQRLDTPLVWFAAHCTDAEDLKPALFYHLLRAEPLAAAVADELIWPALPQGVADRQQVRELMLRYLPELSASSQANALLAIFNAYTASSVARREGDALRFRVRTGTPASFVYLFGAEFPQPGVYRFDALEGGPLRRWLLWDRAWLRQQLYHLEQIGLLAKVSEIDTVRQFTVQYDEAAALRRFFDGGQSAR